MTKITITDMESLGAALSEIYARLANLERENRYMFASMSGNNGHVDIHMASNCARKGYGDLYIPLPHIFVYGECTVKMNGEKYEA